MKYQASCACMQGSYSNQDQLQKLARLAQVWNFLAQSISSCEPIAEIELNQSCLTFNRHLWLQDLTKTEA